MAKNRVKTPVMLQMEATECGAASLGIMLGYYKKFLPLEVLRQMCNVNRNGSNAASILVAAKGLGMDARGFRYSVEKMRAEVATPFIAHWSFQHFLVVEGWDDKKVYLNDPASGHRNVGWDEFEENYTGILLKIKPGENFEPGGEQENVWWDLVKNLAEDKTAAEFMVGVGICTSLVSLGVPLITQAFFDDVMTYDHHEWLFTVLLGLGIALALKLSLAFLRSWCLVRWQGKMTVGDSADFFSYVLHLPVTFFQSRSAGEISSRVAFNESVAEFVTGKLATVLSDFAIALLYLAMLFLYSVQLTLIGLAFTAINIFVTWASFKWLKEQQMKLMQENGRVYGIAVSGIGAIETLKANGNENDFFNKWANANAEYLTATQQQEYYGQYLAFIPSALAGINGAMIMAVGGFSMMDGLMSAGVFVAFKSLMQNFQAPVSGFVGMTQDIQRISSMQTKINDVYRYPREEEKIFDESERAIKLSGKLELKDITFGYAKGEAPLIEGLNLTLDPGRRVAIVGRSGSGKSTLAKIVSGLYQPWSGEVLFSGVSSGNVPREIFAKTVAVVEQEIFLLEGTIAENIALFNPNVSLQNITQAAKDAMIHDDISVMQGGYDAMVDEGGYNLSGGQRQRLELARALATNPKLLILDEVTSALDPLTEKEIMKNIRRRGCACLIVAHRLSTIRDADEIIALRHGKVVERGTHEELVAQGGYYAAMIKDS